MRISKPFYNLGMTIKLNQFVLFEKHLFLNTINVFSIPSLFDAFYVRKNAPNSMAERNANGSVME